MQKVVGKKVTACMCLFLFLLSFAAVAQVVPGTLTISIEKAKEIALAKTGGGTVGEIDMDNHWGRIVYELEVYTNNAKYDVYIDAQTGEIVKFWQDLDWDWD